MALSSDLLPQKPAEAKSDLPDIVQGLCQGLAASPLTVRSGDAGFAYLR